MSDPIGGFGKPGDILREISEGDLQSLNAAGQYVAERYGCMVTIGDDPPKFCGSGTLVRIADDVFVATAKHLFEKLPGDAKACFWWGLKNEHECVPISNIRCPSGDIDVAAARLTQIPDHALSVEHVDLDPIDNGSVLWTVSGISQTGVLIDYKTRTMNVVWWSLGLCPLPPDRWPTNLPRTPDRDRDLFAHYSNRYALDRHGKAMGAVDPRGLSGGGIWAVQSSGGRVWRPDDATRLIGIQWATAENKWSWLYGTRIREWLKVVRDNWSNVAAVVTAKLQGAC